MIRKNLFGTLETGEQVFAYTLSRTEELSVKILDFGATVAGIKTVDKNGRSSDIVKGYDSLSDYVTAGGYPGATIGRVANRIDKGRFSLDGKAYQIFCNNDGNSLHGGKIGFSHRLWEAAPKDGEEPELVLHRVSPDGEENYPGTLDITVTYRVTKENALSIHYEAFTDRRTVCNLTNHTYFNLGGFESGKVFDHRVWIDADRFLPVRDGLIPTGEIRSVEGTSLDFRVEKTIGRDFDLNRDEMLLTNGYDHYLLFSGEPDHRMKLRATAYDPVTGRKMEVFTDQPGLQFYSANFLKNPLHPLYGGLPQTTQIAFCMETGKAIDAINHEGFHDISLNPGETYDYTTVYRFSAE